MTVSELVHALDLTVVAGSNSLDRAVDSGYVSDLLSDVMAHAREGGLWVTSQAHQNIVAVALLTGVACIVVAGGIKPGDDAVARAEAEGVPLLLSDLPAFEVVGRAYALGIRGSQR